MNRWRPIGMTMIAIVLIAGTWYFADRILRVGSEQGLSDLTCGDGQIVVFVEEANLWECANPPSDTLAGLSCSEGQLPVFRANQWVCEDAPSGPFAGLACSDGQIAIYDGTSNSWVCGDLPGDSDTLAGLSCAGGQVASFNGTSGNWECTSPSGGSDTLAGLSCTSGQIASYNSASGNWECANPSGGSDTLAGLSCTSGQIASFNSTSGNWECATPPGDSDTLASLGCTGGQFLQVDPSSGNWVCIDQPAEPLRPYMCNNDQILQYDTPSDHWQCVDLPADRDTLAGLSCAGGQFVSYDTAANSWTCVNEPRGTLGALTCAGGQTAVYDAASGNWGCGWRRYVLKASNGNVVGPVVGYDGNSLVLAMTLNDTSGNPHTFLQRFGAGGSSNDDPGFETNFDSGAIYFENSDCSGTPYFLPTGVEKRRFEPVYESTVTIEDAGDFDVYLVDLDAATVPWSAQFQLAGKRVSYGGCVVIPEADKPQLAGYRYHPGELLADNLEAQFPRSYTLEAQ